MTSAGPIRHARGAGDRHAHRRDANDRLLTFTLTDGAEGSVTATKTVEV